MVKSLTSDARSCQKEQKKINKRGTTESLSSIREPQKWERPECRALRGDSSEVKHLHILDSAARSRTWGPGPASCTEISGGFSHRVRLPNSQNHRHKGPKSGWEGRSGKRKETFSCVFSRCLANSETERHTGLKIYLWKLEGRAHHGEWQVGTPGSRLGDLRAQVRAPSEEREWPRRANPWRIASQPRLRPVSKLVKVRSPHCTKKG